MQRKLLIPLGVSALLLGAVVFLALRSGPGGPPLLDSRDGRPAGEGPPAGGATGPGVASTGALSGAALASEEDPEGVGETEGDAVDSGDAVLHGRVTDARSTGISGARVLLSNRSSYSREDPERRRALLELALGKRQSDRSRVVARTAADASGRYSFNISELAPGAYHVLAVAEDMAPQSERWNWSPESTRLDFQLIHGESIAGVVRGLDGEPVEGAVVEATEEGSGNRRRSTEGLVAEAHTDADGRFRLSVGGGNYRVTADGVGYAAAAKRRVPAGSSDVVLELPRARSLRGLVTDETGLALGDVEVALYQDGGSGEAGRSWGRSWGGGESRSRPTTPMARRLFAGALARSRSDEEGAFRFDEIGAGRFTVLAEKAAHRPAEVAVRLDEERLSAEVTVVLRKGLVLSGRVEDAAGEAVAGAVVVLARDPGGSWGRRQAQERKEADEREKRLETAQRFEELERYRKERTRRAEQRGRRPVNLYYSSVAAETDSEGRFLFDTLEKASYVLSVEANDFVPYREEDLDLDGAGREIEIVLDSGIQLEGTVASSLGGRPAAGAKLIFVRPEDVRTVKADEDGKYQVSGLVAGDEWDLTVDAPGFSMAMLEDVEVAEDRVQRLDIQLDPSSTVSGRVTDSSGAPVARASVRIQEVMDPAELSRSRGEGGGEGGGEEGSEEGSEEAERRERRDLMRRYYQEARRWSTMAVSSRTDADGRFVLDEVNPAPSLQLSVSHPDHKAYRSETLAVAPGEHVSGVDIRLVTGGRLVVTVSTPAGERLSGAGVRIRLSEQSRERGADGSRYRIPESRYRMFGERRSSSSDWRMTDASGVAAFSGVTAGVYSISVDVKGYQPFRDSVTVAADQAVDAPVALLPGNTIGGVVVDSTGNPVAGASVRAREEVEDEGDGGESSRRRRHESWTRSREDGSFVVGSLGPGPYELRVYRRGYAEGRLHSVPVNSDQNVVLERLGSIAGWVLGAETGLPVPAFEIRLLEGGSEAASEDGEGRGFGGDRGDRSRGRGERVRDPQGVFLVDNLAPGRYTVSFSARGYTGARIRVTVADGEAVENLEVRLLEGLAVSGIAIDGKSGLPVAEAQVFLIARSASVEEGRDERRIDGRRSRRERPSRERGRSGRRREADEGQLEALAMLSTLKGRGDALATDEEGYFRLPEVRPGRYTLIVSHDDYVPSSETVTVREDRSSPEVLVRLDRGQELRGKVTFARLLPAAGVTLLFEQGQGITKQVVTDRAGNYTATGFLPGRYSMRVMATRGSETRGVSVTIEKGKNKFDYDIPEESSPRTPGNSR